MKQFVSKNFCTYNFKTKLNKKLDTKLMDGAYEKIRTLLTDLKQKTGDQKVVDFHSPDDLAKLMPFELSYDQPSTTEELLDVVQSTMDYSVRATHPHYMNSLFGGLNEAAIVGDYIASSLNGSIYTYEAAPVYTLMEEELARVFAQLLRMDPYDYMFCPGGSFANWYALMGARQHLFPDIKEKGASSFPAMTIFTSEVGHYSIEKGAIMSGIGIDNICKVATNSKGQMCVKDLEAKIIQNQKEGKAALMVNSTLGTTVLGAVDPINETNKLCKKYGIWHHVDACLGFGKTFSPEFHDEHPLFSEIDSIACDPHKSFPVPLQCSVFMTKHKNVLSQNSCGAKYLFMKDKTAYDAVKYDRGDQSFQCGRHVDITKLWFFWKHQSTKGVIDGVNETWANAKYLANLARNHPNFELVLEPEWTNVSFYYIPDRFLNMERNEEFYKQIGAITPNIKGEIIKEGKLMTAYQIADFGGKHYPNFWRPAIHYGKDREDMEHVINTIHKHGQHI
jgi:glutamate/tyrosine decarboxylase-like PLP-dependent enzyme